MKVLIIGNGNHTNRKIIPALKKLEKISSLTVVDRKSENKAINHLSKINVVNPKTIFKDSKKYNLIIISAYPSAHMEIYSAFKEKGEKFIIEKPISNDFKFMTGKKFKKVYEEQKIIESLAYFHHPFWTYINKLIQNHRFDLLETKFTIPNNFRPTDFRLNNHMGGSSILDNGIYPISLATELLKINFNDLISKQITFDDKLNINISGKAVFTSNNVRKIDLQWGFDKEYKNYLKLKNKTLEINIPFIYSKPENFTPKIYVNKNEEITFRNIDQFRKFYTSVIENKEKNLFYTEYDSIYNRYHLMEKLIND
jgi:xylose dehydrogenase (NAD/NADP)